MVIKLIGGLGNQMFQYALAVIVAKKNNSKLLLDRTFFESTEESLGHTPRNFELDVFKSDSLEASLDQILAFKKLSNINRVKKKLKLNYPKIYNEMSFSFNPKVLKLKAPLYLSGYFQSFKYFLGYETIIQKIFEFPLKELDDHNKEILEIIKKSNSISVHIRRGDYVTNKNTQKFHGNCSLDYYRHSIEYFSANKDATFIFFSDDMDWVKQNFKSLSFPKIFVDKNLGENSWKDMLLMSSCKNNIIANSSFSWWGAWLNLNKNKIVIAPKIWFANKKQQKLSEDILPKEWIQL